MIRFSKFTLNIDIYDEFVGFFSKLVWRKTLFKYPCHQRQKPMHYFLTWQEPYCFCTFGINGSILCVKQAIFLQSQTWVLKKSLLPDFSPEELNWWKSLRQAKFLWQDLFKGSFCKWYFLRVEHYIYSLIEIPFGPFLGYILYLVFG